MASALFKGALTINKVAANQAANSNVKKPTVANANRCQNLGLRKNLVLIKPHNFQSLREMVRSFS